jgi:hypothetical protein
LASTVLTSAFFAATGGVALAATAPGGADGKNFAATVPRGGKQMNVRIDPDADQVAVQG